MRRKKLETFVAGSTLEDFKQQGARIPVMKSVKIIQLSVTYLGNENYNDKLTSLTNAKLHSI